MHKFDRFIEGLKILRPYCNGFDFAAEHDEFIVSPHDLLPIEEIEKLENFGFHWNADDEYFYFFT